MAETSGSWRRTRETTWTRRKTSPRPEIEVSSFYPSSSRREDRVFNSTSNSSRGLGTENRTKKMKKTTILGKIWDSQICFHFDSQKNQARNTRITRNTICLTSKGDEYFAIHNPNTNMYITCSVRIIESTQDTSLYERAGHSRIAVWIQVPQHEMWPSRCHGKTQRKHYTTPRKMGVQ